MGNSPQTKYQQQEPPFDQSKELKLFQKERSLVQSHSQKQKQQQDQQQANNDKNTSNLHDIFNNSQQAIIKKQKDSGQNPQLKQGATLKQQKTAKNQKNSNQNESNISSALSKLMAVNKNSSINNLNPNLQRQSNLSNHQLLQGFGNFLLQKYDATNNRKSNNNGQIIHQATQGMSSLNILGGNSGLNSALGRTFLDRGSIFASGTSPNLSELITNAIMKKYNFRLLPNDLQTPILQAVYKKDKDHIKRILKEVYESIEQQEFQYEVTIGFWMAIHLEYLEIAQYLIQKVPFLKKVVASIMKKKQDNKLISQMSRANSVMMNQKSIKTKRKSQFYEQNKEEMSNEEDKEVLTGLKINKSKIIDDQDDSDMSEDFDNEEEEEGQSNKKRVSLKKRVTVKQHKSSDLDNIVPTEIQVDTETAQTFFEALSDITQLIEVKMVMRNEFPTFMTNILKIILRKQETKLSQIIIAYYKTSVTKDILNLAIETGQYDFLYYMFGFGKNSIYYPEQRISKQLTFVKLFKYLRRYKTELDDFKEVVKEICEWKLQTNGGNFLQSLLTYELDDLAITYMGSFGSNLNEDLLLFCLEQQNQKFLKDALMIKAFEKLLFREDSIVEKLLFYLNQGTRTIYILNVFSLIDIQVWKNRQIKDLMDIFLDFAEQNYEKNQLNLCYNPVLTIVLACEILNKISSVRKKFENESKRIVNSLLRLGEMFISKITDDRYYEKLITDQDFQERPVLRIITQNNFERLMDEDDPKAETLMSKVWNGREANNCDGNIFGYSCLSNVVFRQFKRVLASSNRDNGIIRISNNSFEPNFKVDYMLQHRYRSQGIYFYFYKELACAIAMLLIFQVINYQYLSVIKIANNATDPSELYFNVQNNDYEYSAVNWENDEQDINDMQASGSFTSNLGIVSYLFTVAQMFQITLKIVFNQYSVKKIPFDKWAIADCLSALLNIMAVQVLNRVNINNLQTGKIRDFMDYFMIIALALAWIRFFMYFLVVRSISKLLLTLVEMAEDTLSFFFIVSCFIMIMSSIFTTLYQDVNPDRFGSLTTTVRTLFDAALSVYSYDGMGGRTLSYSILIIFHVFFTNVLLLNYLIAILSTTYDNMKKSGIFKYKKNLYEYCERFITCFEEKAYGELVLQPPPLSYACIILLPFLRNKPLMVQKSKQFSIMMFWIENSYIIGGFFIYEIILVPFAFIKTLSNIVLYVDVGIIRKIILVLFWIVGGIFIDFYLIYRDLCNLLIILTRYNGFNENQVHQLNEDNLDINTQIDILNLARDGVITLFKTLKSHFRGDSDQMSQKKKNQQKKKTSKIQKFSAGDGAEERRKSGINNQSFLDYSDNQSQVQKSVRRKTENQDDVTGKSISNPLSNNDGKQNLQVPKSPVVTKQNSNVSASDGSSELGESYKFSNDELTDLDDFVIEDEIYNLELNAGYNPNDQRCLYVVKRSSILEDWKVRRKLQIQQQRNQQKLGQAAPAKEQPGNSFKNIAKNIRAYSLLVPQEEIKLVSSDKNDDEDESQLNKGFQNKKSSKFNNQQKKSKYINIDNLVSSLHNKTRKKLDDQFNRSITNNYLGQQAKTHVPIQERSGTQKGPEKSFFENYPSQAEIKCINKFFNNFVIVSESSLTEHIDIVMFLRALPNRITTENIHKVNLFNFKIFQESRIAYQNLDLVNTFEYFDEKNRERVQSVKEKLSDQKGNLQQVRDIVKFVKRKMYNHEGLMKNLQDQNQNDVSNITNSLSMKKKLTLNRLPLSSPLFIQPTGKKTLGSNTGRFQQQFMKGASLTPVPDKDNGFFSNNSGNSPLNQRSQPKSPQPDNYRISNK